MRTLRRLHLILVTALSLALPFSLTANQAHKAAHLQRGTILCARHTISFAATAPRQQQTTIAAFAPSSNDPAPAIAWLLALALHSLLNSVASRRFSSATREAITIAPQRSRFALRL